MEESCLLESLLGPYLSDSTLLIKDEFFRLCETVETVGIVTCSIIRGSCRSSEVKHER